MFYKKAFDQHLNLVLGEVEECITTKEVDEETEEEMIKVSYNSKQRDGPLFLLVRYPPSVTTTPTHHSFPTPLMLFSLLSITYLNHLNQYTYCRCLKET